MANKQKKWYVVWKGRQPGVYDTWAECSAQVQGYAGAKYKSFLSRQAAVDAFGGNSGDYIRKGNKQTALFSASDVARKPIMNSISVDAACASVPGRLEYRGVKTATKEIIFEMGPFEEGTNNIGEFLAIVNAAAILKKEGNTIPIYSDSKTALAWVRKKKANTTLKCSSQNKKLFELIAKAENWLHANDIINKILKWETKAWGEIPADYGRK